MLKCEILEELAVFSVYYCTITVIKNVTGIEINVWYAIIITFIRFETFNSLRVISSFYVNCLHY